MKTASHQAETNKRTLWVKSVIVLLGVSLMSVASSFVVFDEIQDAEASTNNTWHLSGTSMIFDYDGGKVGIGTSSPDGNFQVEGSTVFHRDDWGNDTIVLRGQKDTANKWGEYAIRTGYTGLIFRNTQTGTTMMHLSNAGDIGVGKLDPQAKLDVKGTVRITEDGSGELKLRPATSGGNAFVIEHTTPSGNLYVRSRSATSETGDLILNDLGGGVLIGAVSTPSLLQVEGGAVFHRDDWGNDTIVLRGQKDTTNKWGEYAIRTGYLGLTFRNTQTGTTMMHLANGGNVGIGTDAPDNKLDVAGDLDVSSVSYLNGIILDNDADITGADEIKGWNDLRFYGDANGGPDLYISPSGGVGIGTTDTHGLKLAVEGSASVNGTFQSTQIIVDTNVWADYVFADDYQLMPLTDLARYVDEHDHLPGVPTTAEVTADGVDVADTQAVLLEKVEELTLYTIQQDQKITELTRRLEALEAR